MFKDYGKKKMSFPVLFSEWLLLVCLYGTQFLNIWFFLTTCFCFFPSNLMFHKAKLLGLISKFLKYEPKGGAVMIMRVKISSYSSSNCFHLKLSSCGRDDGTAHRSSWLDQALRPVKETEKTDSCSFFLWPPYVPFGICMDTPAPPPHSCKILLAGF